MSYVKSDKNIKKGRTMKLSEFASIYIGYNFQKDRASSEPCYTYKAYQNPCCSDEADIYCYGSAIPEQYLTRDGDIVINIAKLADVTLIEKDQEGLLVSARYLIIRCDQTKAFPGYIKNEMLSDKGIRRRKAMMRFSGVLPYQKANNYAHLKFNLPNIDRQKTIYDIQKNIEDSLTKFMKTCNERYK
ncbi:MAG: hypothetical protein IKJ59_14145 [Clostridia bacterium]|nr:hypothetical protein [Clostridia bacterium]